MRSPLLLFACVALLTGGLAGCLGSDEPAEPAAAPEPTAEEAKAAITDDGSQEANLSLGEQEHIHDYWKGRELITLVDEEVTVDTFTTLGFTFFNTFDGTPGVGGAFIELPDSAIVYEGTGEVQVTITWSDPTITGMAMQYRSAAGDGFSEKLPITKATATSIMLTPDMTDMPHSKTSRWMFVLQPAQAGQVITGTFQFKVDIIKTRDPEMFPGHPDLFHGKNTLELFKGVGKSAQTSGPRQFTGFITQSSTDDSIISNQAVPMMTQSIVANMTISNSQATVGQVSNVWLEYRPADSFRYYRAQTLSADLDTGAFQFAIPVIMEQTDSPYADSSQWHFRIRASTDPTGQGDAPGPARFFLNGISDVSIDFEMEIIAYDALLDGIDPWKEPQGRGGQ